VPSCRSPFGYLKCSLQLVAFGYLLMKLAIAPTIKDIKKRTSGPITNKPKAPHILKDCPFFFATYPQAIPGKNTNQMHPEPYPLLGNVYSVSYDTKAMAFLSSCFVFILLPSDLLYVVYSGYSPLPKERLSFSPGSLSTPFCFPIKSFPIVVNCAP